MTTATDSRATAAVVGWRDGLARLAVAELRRSPGTVAALVGLSLVLAGLSIVPPVLVGRAVDVALAQALTARFLGLAAVAIVGAAALDAGLLQLRRRIAVTLELAVRDRLASEHFAAAVRLPLTALDGGGEPALIRSFDDLDTVVEFVASRSVEMFAQVLIALAYVTLMLIVSAPLALAFVGMSIAGLAGSLAAARDVERSVGGWLAARDRRFEHVVECLTSLLTIKTLGAHRQVETPFAEVQGAEQSALARFRLTSARADTWARFWAILIPAGGTLIGVALMWQGEATAGDIVVFLSLSGGLTAALVALFDGARRFHEARASADRLARLADHRPEIAPGAPDPVPAAASGLAGEGLAVVHAATTTPVFADLSLAVAPGEHIAVIGRSGGGKTTLALALARMMAPRAGRVTVAGDHLALADHRAAVLLVPHQVALYSASLRDNVGLWDGGASDDDITVALTRAGLGPFLDGLAEGLDTPLGNRGLALSAGQRQRISLARVFLRRPAVLILDEATSALDPETEAQVLANLRAAMYGRSLLVVTHREAVAASFDRVLRLESGVLHEVDGASPRVVGRSRAGG